MDGPSRSGVKKTPFACGIGTDAGPVRIHMEAGRREEASEEKALPFNKTT
jgi:hypothetical protein